MHLRRFVVALAFLGCTPALVIGCRQSSSSSSALHAEPGAGARAGWEGNGLTPAQSRGQRIWYEACGDNGRFHTYVAAQRLGAPQAWGKVLASKSRDQRWSTWGLIQDPDCQPGDDSTFGFDICPGDRGDDGGVAPTGKGYQGLLSFVGTSGYKDPGCWISGTYNEADCPLGLGTSTGALGYRKFPNPRFDANNWPGWDAYDPTDSSVEPPFLIGTACGSCHIAFDPVNPPSDPAHPQWKNIKGLVGNQFENVSEILGSGLDPHSFEWQAETNARAGTVDTSAHPNDLVYNPGTINAILNLAKRPPGLPPGTGPDLASFDKQIYDDKGNLQTQRVFNILKGGEDDVGGAGAVLRVYINIGTCSEQCWMNHLLDNRSVNGRGSQQTPFDQNQCRRDCPSYASLETRYPDVLEFFLSKASRPSDLKDALFPADPPAARYQKLVQSLGTDKINLGRQVFARECAKCHSSQRPPLGEDPQTFFSDLAAQSQQTGKDLFLAEDANGERLDWLGNDERTPITTVGTVRCRSLHSNHMAGHVWDEFSSETYKHSPTPPGIPELQGIDGGGRGYMRNVSLLSVWTQAPFMHNNAVGTELCNKLHPRADCVDKDSVPLADGRTATLPSVAGRLAVFDDSMRALLNPAQRGKKVTRTDQDIVIPIGPQANIDLAADLAAVPYLGRLGLLVQLVGDSDMAKMLKGATIKIPAGTPVALLASLDYRKLVKGLMADLAATPPLQRPQALVAMLNAMFQDPAKLVDVLAAGPKSVSTPGVYAGYSNCTDIVEDKGHEFGAALSQAEKDALIAFMKTL